MELGVDNRRLQRRGRGFQAASWRILRARPPPPRPTHPLHPPDSPLLPPMHFGFFCKHERDDAGLEAWSGGASKHQLMKQATPVNVCLPWEVTNSWLCRRRSPMGAPIEFVVVTAECRPRTRTFPSQMQMRLCCCSLLSPPRLSNQRHGGRHEWRKCNGQDLGFGFGGQARGGGSFNPVTNATRLCQLGKMGCLRKGAPRSRPMRSGVADNLSGLRARQTKGSPHAPEKRTPTSSKPQSRHRLPRPGPGRNG